MKIRFILVLTCLIFGINGIQAQQASVNNYKYVIVPEKFEFLNEANQYRLNELTAFLFEKSGFTAYMANANDKPSDLKQNPCLALKSNVVNERAFLSTKLVVELVDCSGQVIYTSEVGKSKEKEYKVAYNLALRDAFKSVAKLDYNYKPGVNQTPVAVQSNQQTLQPENPTTTNTANTQQNINTTAKVATTTTAVTAVAANQANAVKPDENKNVLYAQKIGKGYQLVNSEPKIVYKIKPSSLENVFLVEGKEAILFKKDNDWVIEFYSNSTLKTETLNIKF